MTAKSLRYKIEQTVIGQDPAKCGGIFVGGEIIKTSDTGAAYTLNHTESLQSKAKKPLLIPADIESGSGCAVSGLTELPSMMGLGAANDEKVAYNYGLVTAKEARSVGINWAFAPVCDLNMNPRNPLVNIRSISDNPDHAIPLLKAVVKGMQDGGIAACIKHFPGDGVDWRDQHHTTTCNSLSFNEYMKNHGRVFKELIDSGVYSIMAGHITLPCYQNEKLDGFYPPATLSKELLVNLLRNEMGFDGLVVSDALMMGGFLGWNKSNEESEILAFKNGCDMMLWPNNRYVDNMLAAVENGFVSEARIDEAFKRVEALKDKLGITERKYSVPLTAEDKKLCSDTCKECYEKSLTLVCDNNSQLPLKGVKKIAIIPVGMMNNRDELVKTSMSEFKARGFEVSVHTEISHDKLKCIAEKNDKIMFMLFTKPHNPAGPLDFYEWDASAMWASLAYGKEKTIISSFGSPYFKNQYFERAYTYINAYTASTESCHCFVKAVCGEIPFSGTSPVKL